MFFDRKVKVVNKLVAVLESVRPNPHKVQVDDDTEEVASYIRLCQKSGSETPAVKMLRLRHFLADRGIPEYNLREVLGYLESLWRREVEKEHEDIIRISWLPLREVDKDIAFRSYRDFRYCPSESSDWLYPELVPSSVMETVGRIAEEFPDAKFFVSSIGTHPDPFMAVTFPGQPLVIVDFWNEPGFRPTK